MSTIQNETLEVLFTDLGIDSGLTYELEKMAMADSKQIKDLRININNALGAQNLVKKEAYLIAFAISVNEKNEILRNAFEKLAVQEGSTASEIAEVIACVSLMNINNIYYRFKHFIKKDFYQQAPAGIKMSIMMNPVLGKEFFELLSLVISAVNGCEQCVNSHEESVIKNGATQARVLDAIRLGAVIKGFSAVLN